MVDGHVWPSLQGHVLRNPYLTGVRAHCEFGPGEGLLRSWACSFITHRFSVCQNNELRLREIRITKFFFFKDFIFFLFLPKAPWYVVVCSSLWVLLVVACGMPPQHSLMSSSMSAPRIRTKETLGCPQRSARTQPLGHGASPELLRFLYSTPSFGISLGE